jgi:BA14K-like protein
MSQRQMISLIVLAALGIVCVSADAFAARVAARGGAAVHRGAVGVSGGAAGYRGGAYRGGYYRPGVGVAAGAVVGGAVAASQYGYGGYGYNYGQDYGYTSGGQDAAYCAQRYRSYDPASGTYLGNDGRRHPCP